MASRGISALGGRLTGLPGAHPLPQQRARVGIYLHVPFCPHICPYCDFVKTSRFSSRGVTAFLEDARARFALLAPRYLAWACEQARKERAEQGAEKGANSGEAPLATLYFGGGTPGMLDAARYQAFVDDVRALFRLEEFTIETNPYTNRETRFGAYAVLGAGRVTLGAQSLDEAALVFLGRKHSPADVLRSIEQARAAGLEQVQVDLIYGLRSGVRTMRIEDEVRSLVAAGATGISAYALTLEARTPFGAPLPKAEAPRADEDTAASEYEVLRTTCEELGLRQVETSNFSRFEAMHNNVYWYGLPYMGLGTGAHGLLPPDVLLPYGARYRVGSTPGALAPGDDDLPFEDAARSAPLLTPEFEMPRSHAEYVDESIFTFLRTPEGLSFAWLKEHAGHDTASRLEADARISRGISEGRLTLDERGLRVSPAEKIRGDAWCLVVSTVLGSR